ncbi:MAG TPA: TIGR00725 family protein [Myxococcota bacterium]|nr:TIGR00725 family protein [Myxococcota bacterium]HQK51699.1 TIGR00725 family protein [Myxococcota bacterium]
MDELPKGPPRLRLIAVAGDAGAEPESPEGRLAFEVGRRLVDAGHRLLTGGLGGVMEAACRGARSSAAWREGLVLGILPGHAPDAANPFVDIALPTGLDIARNVLVAHADALIAIGGGAGTLSEMALAWQMQRLVIAWRGGGWSGRLADRPVDGRIRYPEIPEDRVYGFDSAEEAVAILQRLESRYRGSWGGIGHRRSP